MDRILDFTLEHPLVFILPAALRALMAPIGEVAFFMLLFAGSTWVFCCFVYYFFIKKGSRQGPGRQHRRRHLIVVRLEEHIEHKPVRRAA